MAKRLSPWAIRALVAFVALLAVAGQVRAAGEWEWTAGQGWVMGAGVSRPTAKEQLHYAYELEQRGEFMDSARQYFLLIQNFPESEEAGIGLQRLARCLFEMENYYTAYKAIEQVIETYPNTGRMSDLVEIELRIAKKMMVSQTPDILASPGMNTREANIRRALEIVDSVIEHDPYGPVAAEAYLVRGEGNLFINEINLARTAFETVRDEFPRSEFVERARFGILQCDSLVGQATPRELQDQLDVLRDQEAQRRRDGGMAGEGDEVDESIRQLTEVEAAKMMTQAEQYGRMGTKKGKEAEQFLYNEILRRYPSSPQAETAMERLGTLKIPKDPGRIAATIRNIKFNPFSWNKDPEPPWIVPQLDPDDVVMVDPGMGPIYGVAETGLPQTAAAASVRPAALPDSPIPDDLGSTAFGPAAPPGAGEQRTYSSDPGRVPPRYGNFGPSPLPTATEEDLIPMSGQMTVASAGSSSQGYQSSSPAPIPELEPSGPPTLRSIDYNTPLSDLVGPVRRSVAEPPLPEYGAPQYAQTYQAPYASDPYYGGGYAAPQQGYVDPYYGQQGYGQPAYGGAPAPAPYYGQPPSGGGWTLGEDFR